MKIYDLRTAQEFLPYRDLRTGQVFMYRGELYLKIIFNQAEGFSVNLKSDTIQEFCNDEKVLPMTAELRVLNYSST